MKQLWRVLVMLFLGVMFMVGIVIFGYGAVTLLDLMASSSGGESMTGSTMSGVALVCMFIGGVLATIAGGIGYSMRRSRVSYES